VYSNESTAGCNFGGNGGAKKIEVAQYSQNDTENVSNQDVAECWDRRQSKAIGITMKMKAVT